MIGDLYLRKSNKDRQRSVTRQRRELRDDLAAEGISIGQEFVDPDLSASVFANKPRPGFVDLVAHISAGKCQMLALWESSRGSRTASEWLQLLELCKRHGTLIRVQSHHRTYDVRVTRDWETLAQDGIKAHGEALTISDRTLAGKRDAARDGKPNGSNLFGYKPTYDDRRKVNGRAEDPDAAPTVRRVFEAVAAGTPVLAVERETGRPAWHIRQMVRNRGYLGERWHNGERIRVVDSETGDERPAWPAIVDEDLWLAANAAINGRRVVRGSELRALVTGLPRCGRDGCDGQLVNIGRDQRGKLAYSCKTCRRCTVGAEALDEFVERAVLARLGLPDAADLFRPRTDDTALAAAERDEKKLRDEMDADYRERAEGRLTAAGLSEIERIRLPKIEVAAAKVRRLRTPPVLRDLADIDIPAKWSTFTPRRRREIVAAVVDLVVDPAVRGRPRFDPARLGRSRWVGDERTWAEIWAS